MFEGFLWNSRLVVLAVVFLSLLSSLALFYLVTIDAVYMVAHLSDYASLVMMNDALYAAQLSHM